MRDLADCGNISPPTNMASGYKCRNTQYLLFLGQDWTQYKQKLN